MPPALHSRRMGHSSAANATNFTVPVAIELTTGAPLLAFEKWPSTAAAKKLVHIFIKNTLNAPQRSSGRCAGFRGFRNVAFHCFIPVEILIRLSPPEPTCEALPFSSFSCQAQFPRLFPATH